MRPGVTGRTPVCGVSAPVPSFTVGSGGDSPPAARLFPCCVLGRASDTVTLGCWLQAVPRGPGRGGSSPWKHHPTPGSAGHTTISQLVG